MKSGLKKTVLLIGILPFTTCFIYYYSSIPDAELGKVDIVIVHAGHGKRIDKGVELLKNGYADKLLFVSFNKESEKNYRKEYNIFDKDKIVAISPPTGYSSSYTDAYNLKRWLQNNKDIKSGIVVSSQYHLPRLRDIYSIFLSKNTYNIKFTAADEKLIPLDVNFKRLIVSIENIASEFVTLSVHYGIKAYLSLKGKSLSDLSLEELQMINKDKLFFFLKAG